MRRLTFLIAGIFCLAAAFWAVGCADPDTGKPPRIRFGTDLCADCRMIIQDPRFAAACVTTDGEVKKFDDVGCLSSYLKTKGIQVRHRWARDFENGEWLADGEGVLVHSPSLVTPMGYGTVVFGNRDAAQKFLQNNSGSIIGGENESSD